MKKYDKYGNAIFVSDEYVSEKEDKQKKESQEIACQSNLKGSDFNLTALNEQLECLRLQIDEIRKIILENEIETINSNGKYAIIYKYDNGTAKQIGENVFDSEELANSEAGYTMCVINKEIYHQEINCRKKIDGKIIGWEIIQI